MRPVSTRIILYTTCDRPLGPMLIAASRAASRASWFEGQKHFAGPRRDVAA